MSSRTQGPRCTRIRIRRGLLPSTSRMSVASRPARRIPGVQRRGVSKLNADGPTYVKQSRAQRAQEAALAPAHHYIITNRGYSETPTRRRPSNQGPREHRWPAWLHLRLCGGAGRHYHQPLAYAGLQKLSCSRHSRPDGCPEHSARHCARVVERKGHPPKAAEGKRAEVGRKTRLIQVTPPSTFANSETDTGTTSSPVLASSSNVCGNASDAITASSITRMSPAHCSDSGT